MSNPRKKLSGGMVIGRGVGGAIGTGGAAALAAAVRPGSFSIFNAGLMGALGGFAGGVLGTLIGHWWDEAPEPWDFPGEMLVAMVATGLFAGVTYLVAPFYFISFPASVQHHFVTSWDLRLFLVGIFYGFLGGALPSAADTLLAKHFRIGPKIRIKR